MHRLDEPDVCLALWLDDDLLPCPACGGPSPEDAPDCGDEMCRAWTDEQMARAACGLRLDDPFCDETMAAE